MTQACSLGHRHVRFEKWELQLRTNVGNERLDIGDCGRFVGLERGFDSGHLRRVLGRIDGSDYSNDGHNDNGNQFDSHFLVLFSSRVTLVGPHFAQRQPPSVPDTTFLPLPGFSRTAIQGGLVTAPLHVLQR